MSTDEFMEWFLAEKDTGVPYTSDDCNGTECDEVIEDNYKENSQQIEPPDILGGSISIS